MKDYDGALYAAKQAATTAMLEIDKSPADASRNMARALNGLNAAWDELTDCLRRRIDERDREIRRLLNDLSERQK